MEVSLSRLLVEMKAEEKGLYSTIMLGIEYEKLSFEESKDIKEAKKLLKKGIGVLIDEKTIIYYCRNHVKLFFLTDEYSYDFSYGYTYGETDIRKVAPSELMGKVISVAEADELLKKSFQTKNQDLKRRKDHEAWLNS